MDDLGATDGPPKMPPWVRLLIGAAAVALVAVLVLHLSGGAVRH